MNIWITEELRNVFVIIALWISLLKEYENIFTVLKSFPLTPLGKQKSL